MPIPQAFFDRAHAWWGRDEAEVFLEALHAPPTRGLRLAGTSPSAHEVARILGIDLLPVPWSASAFAMDARNDVQTGDASRGLGHHPLHVAGAFYLQDPAATIVAAAAAVESHECVADLAAAPGGKATALADAMAAGPGVLLANDVHGQRVTELARNLERMGARRAVVTQATPARLAEVYRGRFDVVVLDAPCSGEGMFRKSREARRAWSPATVASCARLQRRLIDAAADMVAPGGRLVYATCTFSPEENEAVAADLLRRRSDFAPLPLRLEGTDAGRPEWVGADDVLPPSACARAWPHRGVGDGHTVVTLTRTDGPATDVGGRYAVSSKNRDDAASRDTLEAWSRFVSTTFVDAEETVEALGPGTVTERAGGAWWTPDGGWSSHDSIATLRPGLALGVTKAGAFEPSHALGRALRGVVPLRCWSVPYDGSMTRRWIEGEEIDLEAWEAAGARPVHDDGRDGFVRLQVEGVPLGWAHRKGGRLRNLRPKGLRGRA